MSPEAEPLTQSGFEAARDDVRPAPVHAALALVAILASLLLSGRPKRKSP